MALTFSDQPVSDIGIRLANFHMNISVTIGYIHVRILALSSACSGLLDTYSIEPEIYVNLQLMVKQFMCRNISQILELRSDHDAHQCT